MRNPNRCCDWAQSTAVDLGAVNRKKTTLPKKGLSKNEQHPAFKCCQNQASLKSYVCWPASPSLPRWFTLSSPRLPKGRQVKSVQHKSSETRLCPVGKADLGLTEVGCDYDIDNELFNKTQNQQNIKSPQAATAAECKAYILKKCREGSLSG